MSGGLAFWSGGEVGGDKKKFENHCVRRARYAGHHWRIKDELVSDVLQSTPLHGRQVLG